MKKKKTLDKYKERLIKEAKSNAKLSYEYTQELSNLTQKYALQKLDACYIIMALEIMKMHVYQKTQQTPISEEELKKMIDNIVPDTSYIG